MSNAFQNDPLQAAQSAFSPLPMMVQRFREMAGPRPAPAPPPDIEETAAAARQPDQSEDKGPFNWANKVLPPGSPFPPKRAFQPFLPASLSRPSHQWGQEEQFPNLPHSFEAPGLAQSLTKFFGQNGSQTVSMLAAQAGPHAAEFLAGVMQGQDEAIKRSREQLAMKIAQMKETQEEELTRYADVMAAHGAINETTDPAKMLKPVNGKDLLTDLHDAAVEIGDYGKPGTLGDLIEAGAKPSEVDAFLKLRDNRLRDLQKLKTKMDDDTADAAAWGLTPKEPTSYIGAYPSEPGAATPDQTSAAPTTTPTPEATTGGPAPAAPASSAQVAGPGAPPTPDAEGSTATSSGDPNNPLPPWAGKPATPAIAAIHTALKEAKYDPELLKTNPQLAKAIMLGTEQGKAFLSNLIKNPPKDGKKILPLVRAIDPQMASDVKLVAENRMPASGGISGTGGSGGAVAQQYSDWLRDFATIYTGGKFDQGKYQQIQSLVKSQQVANTVGRVTTMATSGAHMMEVLDQMPPGSNAKNWITRGLRNAYGQLTGEGIFADRNAAWFRYNQELTTLIRNTGGSVTETEIGLHNVNPYTGTPEAYRRTMVFDAEVAKDRLDQNDLRYHQLGGPDAHITGWDQSGYDTVTKIANTEPVNNVQPGAVLTLPDGTKARWMGVYDKSGAKIPPDQRYQPVQ